MSEMHEFTGLGVGGRRVVVAGATSASGTATCAALADAGATVVALGSNAGRLDELALHVPGIATEVCDLSDSSAVDTLALRLSASGAVDGLVHLVGGWVGGRGIPGQTDDAWSSIERSFRTLRNTSRAFYPALVASEAGRVAIVSSTAVDSPTASAADYAAGKAASESWMRSLAHGFRSDQGESGLRAAAVVFVVKALVDDRMRAAAPEKTFPGYTEVGTLAAAVVGLWDAPAGELDGARIRLP
ncbi:SDR family NAD(P)-dependent oxidoreductase [Herbiconiux sp. CPCC 205763]|uniref:SDR family NAD(P)-dependent oxidoreductase n=1 Tax=Herbiconiux aconitum TaxID=2970913 RepID=A0ABT2GQT2_9MICO|nr:SDR family NAD(P)-dependent oxidoreductase [Herbiconiux aconitum]MCS5717304.1 SDR family NAD(P)-dependent oxidoreductase [Herbiconiux aconitum]